MASAEHVVRECQVVRTEKTIFSESAATRFGLTVVDAEWLSGRMPDSQAREHRHESSYGLHESFVQPALV